MQNNFINNLKFIRKQDNITQQDLSNLTGIDRTTLSKWESGTHEIPLLQALKICDALKVPYAEMLGEDLRYQQVKDKTDALWDKYKDKLTDEDKKMIEFVIEKRLAELEREN